MSKQLISSGSPWEPVVGYSRAVCIDNLIFIAGTTASTADGSVIGGDNAYEQAKAALNRIGAALTEAGATFADVVQTRMFVTDISRWEEYGRAHGEVFKDIRPASSMIEVKQLIDPNLLIEIEAIAVRSTQ